MRPQSMYAWMVQQSLPPSSIRAADGRPDPEVHTTQAACPSTVTALIEIPQVCLSEFPTCEQRSVYRLAGAGGGASEAIGCGVVIA
jgi:hypothetical protein